MCQEIKGEAVQIGRMDDAEVNGTGQEWTPNQFDAEPTQVCIYN